MSEMSSGLHETAGVFEREKADGAFSVSDDDLFMSALNESDVKTVITPAPQ